MSACRRPGVLTALVLVGLVLAGLVAPGARAAAPRNAIPAVAAPSMGAVGTTALTSMAQPGVTAAVRPNILVIKTDDQIMDRLSTMRAYMPRVATYFAGSGREFLNSYVSSPSCCQSRASTYVGKYPHNEGVWSQSLGASLDTTGGLGVYLQAAGYRTGLVGKYLNNVWANPPGYDDWTTVRGECPADQQTEDCGDGGPPVWYYNFQVEDNTTARDVGGNRTGATSSYRVKGSATTGSNYNTTWEGRRLVSYLATDLEHPTQPWYLEWDPTAPHTHDTLDVMPEPKYADLAVPGCEVPAETDRTDKPPYVQAWPEVNNRLYGSHKVCPAAQRTLKSVDDVFGQILDQLRAAKALSTTLIVFTSDNGLMNGEHGLLRKYVAYEPSVRVPLLLAWAGHVPPGTTDSRLVSNIDILPTVLEAVGITPLASQPIDGKSLWTGPGHSIILSEYRLDPGYTPSKPTPIPTWAMITNGHLKYIEDYSDKAGKTVAFREYYDLDADPGELTNLLGDSTTANDPDVGYLHSLLDQARTCRGNGTTTTSCP